MRIKPLNIAGLVAVWVLLWGKVTLGTLLMGLVVALLVTVAFPLPGGETGGRVRPWPALRLLGRLMRDLVVASFGVARTSLKTGPHTRSSVVRVQLRSRSELLIATTAALLSLVPGSVIVELDREAGVLFVHSLGVDDEAGMAAARADALELEARIIRAFGTAEDLERLA